MADTQMPVDYYMTPTGDPIMFEEYDRWIRQGLAAFQLLDEERPGGMHPDDRGTQLSDLLCALMHFAQAANLDFNAALQQARRNYAIERRSSVPDLYREMCGAPSTGRQ